ncbi:hypothetical protein TNIN_21471 [Trichonephila inaurata madagascariensis]|uniref:Uncharacterized protein n=1 Tax=Trichonephila inaurata madagascariensis TaxID=2747483 RepID=A0A8X6YBQ4_9ARAC|nr:hypothetical protein TNIN_21471 [Trichonephila inaurata madagascariensis]
MIRTIVPKEELKYPFFQRRIEANDIILSTYLQLISVPDDGKKPEVLRKAIAESSQSKNATVSKLECLLTCTSFNCNLCRPKTPTTPVLEDIKIDEPIIQDENNLMEIPNSSILTKKVKKNKEIKKGFHGGLCLL